MLTLLLSVALLQNSLAFSRFYGKCHLGIRDTELSQLPFQHILTNCDVKQSRTAIPNVTLNYANLTLINHRYIDSGASGQVFLMQDIETSKFYIAKRFFKDGRFNEEEFIMKNLNYEMMWTRDPHYNNTMALYPFNDVATVDEVLTNQQEARIIIYKIVRQLYKSHQLGIMHMDIKPANIIVDVTKDEDGQYITKKTEVTIIDWNLANPYYVGADYSFRRGTACTMAPQLLLWANYYTPAVDIWSLGVTIIRMVTGEKPLVDCSKKPLQAMIRFVGYEKFRTLYDKLRVETDQGIIDAMEPLNQQPGYMNEILEQDKDDGIPVSLRSMLRKMLKVDPQQRITLRKLLEDDYFKNVVKLPPPKQEKERRKKKRRQEPN